MFCERRKPTWVRASLTEAPSVRGRWANTLRSSRPGRYGHGDGAVRKNLSWRVAKCWVNETLIRTRESTLRLAQNPSPAARAPSSRAPDLRLMAGREDGVLAQ